LSPQHPLTEKGRARATPKERGKEKTNPRKTGKGKSEGKYEPTHICFSLKEKKKEKQCWKS
jgi:hypothetical protein